MFRQLKIILIIYTKLTFVPNLLFTALKSSRLLVIQTQNLPVIFSFTIFINTVRLRFLNYTSDDSHHILVKTKFLGMIDKPASCHISNTLFSLSSLCDYCIRPLHTSTYKKGFLDLSLQLLALCTFSSFRNTFTFSVL